MAHIPPHSVPKSYAGIGSRETPDEILLLMRCAAEALGAQGWCLRSGGAPGADDAFEQGAHAYAQEIYLPWSGFNQRKQGLVIGQLPVFGEAKRLASQHHPHWISLKDSVKNLMARNACQVLGRDLQSPSTFVVCWGKHTRWENDRVVDVDGGTGLAVRLAASRGIPVYNLKEPAHRARIVAFVEAHLARPFESVIVEARAHAQMTPPPAARRPRM